MAKEKRYAHGSRRVEFGITEDQYQSLCEIADAEMRSVPAQIQWILVSWLKERAERTKNSQLHIQSLLMQPNQSRLD